MTLGAHDLQLFAPVLILLGSAAVAVTADLFAEKIERGALPFISLGGTVAAAISLLSLWGRNEEAFGGALRIDGLAIVMGLAACAATALSVLMSASYVRSAGVDFGEYYGLMLTAAAGAVILAQANDLMSVFLGIEIMSIAVYCLTGITRDREKSTEAAMKYFIMGAFSTGFLLFGIALLYGAVVTTGGADGILQSPSQSALLRLDALARVPANTPLLVAGLALFLVGAAFKIGAVPFHAWTPDAYEGAPAPVTGFMAGVVKAGVFAVLLRTAMVSFPSPGIDVEPASTWSGALAFVAAATMVVGNVCALAQTNLKRLLAYSSIGHSGVILVGVVVASESQNPAPAAAVLFYVLAYVIMTAGSFGLISLLAREGGELENLSQFSGLAARRPAAAAAMTLFMASLAGIPPTAGFMGKFLIFREAINNREFLWLAITGIAASIVSAYYYLKIVVAMYMRDPEKGEEFPRGDDRWGAILGLALASIATVALGLCPAKVIDWCTAAIQSVN
ncbi:MAG: NADH-quinone oxidoreductase subunit [Planctomycetota bacterium]|nr:MAG: NADH-quinone oxidoreductase subunit [Planctomycetota bacterium]